MKDMVVSRDFNKVVNTVNPNKICRNSRKQIVYNRKETKRYKIVYTKRAIQDDLTTLPYGY